VCLYTEDEIKDMQLEANHKYFRTDVDRFVEMLARDFSEVIS